MGSTRQLWIGVENQQQVSVQDIGGKGWGLIHSHRSGFKVPKCFILTTAFFDPWVSLISQPLESQAFSWSKEDCAMIQTRCKSLTLTEHQKRALLEALDTLSTPLVAIRSSAPTEDSHQASLAGLYRSRLAVSKDSLEHLLNAITTCFSSAFDFRVATVMSLKSDDLRKVAFAVVVQEQIDALVSGVAFSLDPINNCYDEAVISANFGLGETVVAGLVTPDTYTVDKVKKKIVSKHVSEQKLFAHKLNNELRYGVTESAVSNPAQAALSDDHILEVAKLVADVEAARHGEPVDVEWCFDEKGCLYLLQARPITRYVQLFPEMITPPGEIKKLYMDTIIATQGFSNPLSVLGLEIWGRMVELALPQYPHGADGMAWEIHGRQYFILSTILALRNGEALLSKMTIASGAHISRAVKSVDFSEYKPKAATQKNKFFLFSTLKFMFGLVPSLVWGIWSWEKAFDEYNEGWDIAFDRFRPGGVEDLRQDLTFSQAVDNVMECFSSLVSKHMVVLASYYYKWRLDRMFAGDPETQALLAAVDMDLEGNPTSDMGHAMLDLASLPEVQNIFSGKEFVDRLNSKSLSPELDAAITTFVAKFGCRGIQEIDIATPRSSEDLASLFERIKQINVTDNQILKMTDRKKEAMEKLLARAKEIGCEANFLKYSRAVQKMGGYREHPKYIFVFLLAHLRRRALKLGDSFVASGRLLKNSQIFDLSLEQVDLAEKNPACQLFPLIEQNLAPYHAVAHVKDWPLLIDSRGRILRGKREDVEDGLGGDPISPGVVSGKARILHSPDGEPLAPGDILVTKAAEPSWTPIFINATAVVLEVGGPTQHGAIIAREYGIPCVSGVEDATNLIKEGQMIEVDGSTGIVRVLMEESPNH